MTQDIIIKNYANYKRYLSNLIGDESYNQIIEVVGGEDYFMNASFGMSKDSGTAFDGSLVYAMLRIAKYACQLNDYIPEDKKVEKSSIYKVALLSHIAKAVMYTKNTNEWEVKNRGLLYTFTELTTHLKCGERSEHIAANCGVLFTDEEYEAIRIMDKIKESDGMSMWFVSGVLPTVIRQANELFTIEMRP